MRYIGIIATLIFTIYSTTHIAKWRQLNLSKRLFTVIGIFGALIITYFTIYDFNEQTQEGRIKSTFGEIKSKKESKMDDLSLRVRGTGVIFNPKNGIPFMFEKTNDFFQVIRYENRLYLKANVRDGSGKLIANIDGSFWKIYNDLYDYNYDETAFEVVTPDKRVVFQVELQGDYVDFCGLMIDEERNGLYFFPPSPHDIGKQGYSGMKVIHGDKFNIPANLIRPIFKYPREKFLSVRTERIK